MDITTTLTSTSTIIAYLTQHKISFSSLSTRTVTQQRGRSQLQVKSVADTNNSKSSKSEEFCFGLPGSTAPGGNFDPLGLSKGKDENTIKRYREAELTHGRVSMVAALGFIVGENFNPLFDGSIKGPAINHFQQVPTPFWLALGAIIAAIELNRASTGWVDPAAGKGIFVLNDDYIPGDLGWDPLGIKPTNKAEFEVMQTRELNNGRLAMFAIAGEIAQELATGKELFNLEDDKVLIDANCPAGTICDILEKSG